MESVNFKPLNGKVLIKADEAEEKTAGGIIIPDTAKEKPMRGSIVAISNPWYNENGVYINPTVNTGDSVLYPKYSGTEVVIEGEEYLLMKETDLFGII